MYDKPIRYVFGTIWSFHLHLMRLAILRSGYEVGEYGGGHRDSNKMVIEGLEGDDLSPEGELLCNCSTHNGERIE